MTNKHHPDQSKFKLSYVYVDDQLHR